MCSFNFFNNKREITKEKKLYIILELFLCRNFRGGDSELLKIQDKDIILSNKIYDHNSFPVV